MPRPKFVMRPITGVLVNNAYQIRGVQATLIKRYGVYVPRALEATLTQRYQSRSAYSNLIMTDNPIAYYRLAEGIGSVAADYTVKRQDGTINGSVTLTQPGLLVNDPSTCMLFDGSTGYIGLPTTGLPTGAGPWTVEAWIQLPSIPGAGLYPVALSLGTRVSGQCIDLYFNGDDQRIEAGVADGTDIKGASAPTANTPYHLVGTYDGTTITFYINAVSQGTKTVTMNLIYSAAIIGNDVGANLFFSGLIDEVAIYGYPLQASQVLNHYNTGQYIGDSLTISDSFTATNGFNPVESLTVADSLTGTDNYNPVDTLTLSDSLTTANTYNPVDALSISDSLAATDGYNATDPLTISDALNSADGYSATEANIVVDIGNLQAWNVDALTITDSAMYNDNALLLDTLTIADSPAYTDIYLPIDTLMIIDASSMSSGSSGGITNNQMSSEDDLTISDSFTATDGYTAQDVLSISDIGKLQAWGMDTLSISDTLAVGAGYITTDALSLVDKLLATDGVSFVDLLTITDLLTAIASPAQAPLFTSVTWICRDGIATIWVTRDEKAAWDTRDEQALWKTRG